ERFCESMAYSRECCSVEISTSARALRNLAYALLFILPRRIELSTCQVASVKETAQNDQSTHFEMTCQTSKCVGQRLVRLQLCTHCVQRHKQRRRNLVAPYFLAPAPPGGLGAGIRKRRSSQPDMREFMREGKHLGGLRVGSIDEHQRSPGVD